MIEKTKHLNAVKFIPSPLKDFSQRFVQETNTLQFIVQQSNIKNSRVAVFRYQTRAKRLERFL